MNSPGRVAEATPPGEFYGFLDGSRGTSSEPFGPTFPKGEGFGAAAAARAAGVVLFYGKMAFLKWNRLKTVHIFIIIRIIGDMSA